MRSAALVPLLIALAPPAARAGAPREVRYVSSADGTEQPAMFHAPRTGKPVPLVVALHTWSGDYRQKHHSAIAKWCAENGWAYIHPNFRGPNRRPEATGSDLVVGDIASAVEYAKGAAAIDSSAVYLVGTSGGGYTALLMAGRRPELWAGVSAWVPISDLAAWYRECRASRRRYYKDIAASCGGAPGASPAVDREYRRRSPLTHLARARGVPLHVSAGIHDGHKGSVPVSHSLFAFNELADAGDRISPEDIRFFVKEARVPEHLSPKTSIADPSYGKKRPLFRRTSGSATVTIFEGGHELVAPAAIAWIGTVHEKAKAERGKARADE
ncbi:MAG: alpha/beta hydrolase family protein [Planctomycetota bacterium]|jgi:dipeptidyl aminopeptidase/acylaminoacyl peptidase